MLYPSIDELILKVDGRYTLVVATFLRARELRNGKQSKMMALNSKKQVGIALEEIYGNQIIVKRSDQ